MAPRWLIVTVAVWLVLGLALNFLLRAALH
jgi:hypothetical protein